MRKALFASRTADRPGHCPAGRTRSQLTPAQHRQAIRLPEAATSFGLFAKSGGYSDWQVSAADGIALFWRTNLHGRGGAKMNRH